MNKRNILVFWLPLAATWLMMSFEGPFLTAVIARLTSPTYNLAAWGVAFSFALIIEAPIIMIMSASTALVEDRGSYLKLRNFTFSLNGLITICMVIFLIRPVFDTLTINLIGLPLPVSQLTYYATLLLLPWPGAIGYRRFYQGILIRHHLTRRVAYGTVIRMSSIALSALSLYWFLDLPGVVVAATALSIGVCFEALASRLMAHKTVKVLLMMEEDREVLSLKQIIAFYYPLALTSLLALGVHPLVTFFIGHSRMAIESLAVLPVINSLVFIFRSLGLSYQEAGIALVGKNWEGLKAVREFALFLALFVVGVLGIIAFSPLSDIWFGTVSGLSRILSDFSILPLQIMVMMPGLSVLLSFQRAILVAARQTKYLTWATALEVIGIITILYFATGKFDLTGVVAATLAYVLGRIAANIYLIKPILRIFRATQKKAFLQTGLVQERSDWCQTEYLFIYTSSHNKKHLRVFGKRP
jgi:hypothetical protein